MRVWLGSLAAVFALAAAATRTEAAEAPAAAPAPAAVDYQQASNWLCRPGQQDSCATAQVGAMAVDGVSGTRTPQTFTADPNAPIDCFYVYPTVSRDASDYSDLQPGPEEIAVVRSQAARFGTRCRVFAPMYRQLTIQALNNALAGAEGKGPKLSFDPPYEDVRAAWRDYMARDNKGRGVVLIGHSQGTILLTRLIAEEIDGKPAQKLLVSALLAGHPGLGVPMGKDVGGAFKHIPLCHAADQLGCVFVWSSYADADQPEHRAFGANVPAGQVAACVNPAAPGGGRGMLKGFVRKPAAAPAQDPPYVEVINQLTAECVADAQGAVLRIRPEPGPYQGLLATVLEKSAPIPGWGLHILDVPLTQGNLLDVVETQAKAWLKAHPRPLANL